MTITLTREEAQQVLKVLNAEVRIYTDDNPEEGPPEEMLEAIETLRARLAQPEPEQTRSEKMREAGYTKRDTRLECDECGKKFTRQMLPVHDCQPEPVSVTDKLPKPEPVAWTVGGLITDFSRDFSAYKTKAYTRPLYTAPPQREWQGLTDEEAEILIDAHWEDLLMLIELIEAKLKQKNA